MPVVRARRGTNCGGRDLTGRRSNVRHVERVGYRSEGQPSRLFTATRGTPSMCDYSLDHVASRPASIEDKLVTTNFHNSITRGFAAVGQPHVAVCLRPGTELAFENNVECEPAFGMLPTKKIGQKLARFRQINMDQPTVHHDALEFPDGQIVLVSRLCIGQRATVLQLPAAVSVTTERKEGAPHPLVA